MAGEDWVGLCLWWCDALWDTCGQEIRTAAVSLNTTAQTGCDSVYRKWGQSPIAHTMHTHTRTIAHYSIFHSLFITHTLALGAVIIFLQCFLWIQAKSCSLIIITNHRIHASNIIPTVLCSETVYTVGPNRSISTIKSHFRIHALNDC